jgi:hypothetical protein
MLAQKEYNEYVRLFDLAEKIDYKENPKAYAEAHDEANTAYWIWHGIVYGNPLD